ncbi:MAG TPA: TraR/DksA C4-type zinc finger protein [Myxococcales bacterium]|nr:TraR/DksA C4-type zinc finger protein [Myxococcales bacterium]
MAQVRCDSCGKMIDDQRAVRMENRTLCQECARKAQQRR